MEVLRETIQLIEGLLPDPWKSDRLGPLKFSSLVGRLDKISETNKVLGSLERLGLALFYGSTWESALMPVSDEFGGDGSLQRPNGLVCTGSSIRYF